MCKLLFLRFVGLGSSLGFQFCQLTLARLPDAEDAVGKEHQQQRAEDVDHRAHNRGNLRAVLVDAARLWTVWKDDLTPLQMLFGLGGDAANARLNIDDYSVKYMMLLNGDVFDSAHNEYLQHLICGGAVGLTSWLAFLGLHVRRGLRTAPGLAAAILGYAVQAFFSISMPGVLPLVFVLAALCVKPQPLAARGWYRSLLGLVMAAPPILLLAAV